jgi:hypothetical protein
VSDRDRDTRRTVGLFAYLLGCIAWKLGVPEWMLVVPFFVMVALSYRDAARERRAADAEEDRRAFDRMRETR